MRPVIRRALRVQRIAFALICLMLFVLATAFSKTYGWTAALLLWAGLIALMEVGYRRVLSFEAHHRREWWARPRRRHGWSRFYIYAGCAVVSALINSPFFRYATLALLAGGLICAGIIRLVYREEEM